MVRICDIVPPGNKALRLLSVFSTIDKAIHSIKRFFYDEDPYQSKSLDWFLYDRDLSHERVIDQFND